MSFLIPPYPKRKKGKRKGESDQMLVLLLLALLATDCVGLSNSVRGRVTMQLENGNSPKSMKTLTTTYVNTLVSTTAILTAYLRVNAADEVDRALTRADVGFIDLNTTQPIITDTCWFDVQIGQSDPQRIEISLFGEVTPITAENFKLLCKNKLYQNSEIFRIIQGFSVQGGNTPVAADIKRSTLANVGKAYSGVSFKPENYKILHSYKDAGIVSMMKDIKSGDQDSRFFITLSPFASWADGRYVAFGKVSKGMNYITGLQVLPVVPPSNYPETQVRIVDSGVY